jgi:hypothetical protein
VVAHAGTWLNSIEKLWRWLWQNVLKLHRLLGNWFSLQHLKRSVPHITEYVHQNSLEKKTILDVIRIWNHHYNL